ncbi:bactericidal permeability-increasing protein-like [Bufo gargarizans]|uniref:bactericidal permeability-increasing protein-like n=1 Tax=Bufo gargarizans TaxID=30331 RepID=UPI001CF3BD15|nr:bactericidal permeability-increasing protein-like [Bufo gargarizans]XP_044129067.1 bactericidal permeability-increasing protein-like [Bufo gargarizans]XP_044129068.1 bactericidal permeability-increasing protein-like [Bufo gargarizans]
MELNLILLTFGFILSKTKATDPGIKGRLTMKGLQYGWQVGLEEMHKRLETVHLPDVNGSVSVAVLGRIYYYVTELKIKNLDLSASEISFAPDTGVSVSINNGEVHVTGHLRIKTVLFSASSWLELQVQGLTLNGVLGITCDDTGHGAVWNAGCSSSAKYVNLQFHGGAGWLFNMFKDAIVEPIHDALHKQICPAFSNAVENMEKSLSNFPVSLNVDMVSSFEISLLGPPLITEKRFDLLVKGDFVDRSHHWDLPFPPEKLFLPDVDSRMLLLALSEFTANSAGFVYYKAGALMSNVTDEMIPKQSPLRLNVKSLAMFVPELPSHFPDSPPIVLQVSARSAPTVTCQPDSLTVQASADIQAFVTYPNQTWLPIFQIQADSLTAVNVVLSNDTLGATISVKNFSLTLVHSNVGPIKMDALQKTLSFGLKIMTPVLNERLKKMIPLPTPLVCLQDPTVRVLQGYLVIMTDLQVTPFSHHVMKP